jgi:hypothetical protein
MSSESCGLSDVLIFGVCRQFLQLQLQQQQYQQQQQQQLLLQQQHQQQQMQAQMGVSPLQQAMGGAGADPDSCLGF